MKYDLSAIMSRAWAIFRKAAISFAEALHRAWQTAKARPVNDAAVEEDLLREAAARAEQGAEVVLTGREPAAWMQDAADYSTELRAVKHPYTRGIAAREGVEY